MGVESILLIGKLLCWTGFAAILFAIAFRISTFGTGWIQEITETIERFLEELK